MAHGPWSMVHGPWSMVKGQVVKGPSSPCGSWHTVYTFTPLLMVTLSSIKLLAVEEDDITDRVADGHDAYDTWRVKVAVAVQPRQRTLGGRTQFGGHPPCAQIGGEPAQLAVAHERIPCHDEAGELGRRRAARRVSGRSACAADCRRGRDAGGAREHPAAPVRRTTCRRQSRSAARSGWGSLALVDLISRSCMSP